MIDSNRASVSQSLKVKLHETSNFWTFEWNEKEKEEDAFVEERENRWKDVQRERKCEGKCDLKSEFKRIYNN